MMNLKSQLVFDGFKKSSIKNPFKKDIPVVIIVVITCFGILNVRSQVVSQKKDPPNILFFITDDESWLERSAYNWSKLPTPHFDRVARDGVLFAHAYTSAPSCAPSRAAVLTGHNFWELKQGAFIQAWLPKEFPVLPDLLALQGYHVGLTGKGWGPGVHPKQGHPNTSAGKIYNDRKLKPSERIENLSPIDYSANFDVFLSEREKGQPFFFWLGTSEPHDAYDENNYKRLEKEFGVSLADVSVPKFIEDNPENRRKRANMLYEICYADRQLGKALELLDYKGELENTIVIVTSDNGTSIGGMGKSSPYDWGVHEPLAIMWPKQVPAGRTVTDFVNFADFAPTLLDAAGLEIPKTMTGRSFLPTLVSDKSGRVETERDFMVTGLEWHGEFDPESRSFRTFRNDKYAYIVRYSNARPPELYTAPESEIIGEELYDIEQDPWQLHNLVDDKNFVGIRSKLKTQLTAYALKMGDPRFTGDMSTFRLTREFVQDRKRVGYDKTME